MSSRNGMPRADIDTGLMHDRKVIALARRYRDEQQTSTALMLYVSAVLTSWSEDKPLTVAETAPAWVLGDVAPYVVELHAVGLVDEDGRVPESTLDSWMAGARAASERGRAAASARWSTDRVMRTHNGRNARAMPSPTVPTSPTRARAREGAKTTTKPKPLAELIGPFEDIVAGGDK